MTYAELISRHPTAARAFDAYCDRTLATLDEYLVTAQLSPAGRRAWTFDLKGGGVLMGDPSGEPDSQCLYYHPNRNDWYNPDEPEYREINHLLDIG